MQIQRAIKDRSKNAERMILLGLASALLAFFTCGEPNPENGKAATNACKEMVNQLKINQIQVLGSHNSYRQNVPEDIAALLADPPMPLPEGFDVQEWDYGHLPLHKQFDDYGIRSIELDVYNDPEGGLFYNRKGNGFVGRSPDSGEEKLKAPGLKVLHYPDFDYRTNYLTFKDALLALRLWSNAHPGHLPITVIVEPKEDSPADLVPGKGLTSTIPFDKTALGIIDEEIKEIFGEHLSQVLTPDEVRGNHATLNEAVRKNSLPNLAAARGKIIFVMLPSKNELTDYLDGHPSLEGRVMFAFSKPGAPEAMYLNFNDPIANEPAIQQRVREGYLVRTRADANTVEARSGDFTKKEAAIRSGAQIISTDYYRPDERKGWSNYEVHFPNRELALVNPLNGEGVACEIEE